MDNKRLEERTEVRDNVSCNIAFNGNSGSITAKLENLSPGGACIYLGDIEIEIKDEMAGILKVEGHIDSRLKVAWHLFNRIGVMFENKISKKTVKLFQK